MSIHPFRRCIALLFGLSVMLGLCTPGHAAGDLLVAPTRIVLDGPRGAEVVLNNIGTETATYRVSLELKRMREDGSLEDIELENATPAEQATLDMLFYSPRRVILPPNQPQTIRVGVRPPAGLPDGEYRAHLLFRAVRDPVPAAVDPNAPPATGVSISLTPIYGVTIPIIIRQGALTATAAIANPRIESSGDEHALRFDLSKQGNRSVYGEVIVERPGAAEPLLVARGVAIYAETGRRVVTLPISAEQAALLRGPIKVRYIEDRDAGGATIAEVQGDLR
jgi:hypothetical protein